MTASTAFERLRPGVQRWVWRQEWSELRDIQEQAIHAILDGGRDVIISAATAGGKTEAAFLPILSLLAEDRAGRNAAGGFEVVALSPLKALINDQARRLAPLCEAVEVPLTRWHGDVGSAEKKRALRAPGGVLIITPESLEALFVLRGLDIPRLFAGPRFVVVDELHAFLVSERGIHLRSLMHRIDRAVGRTSMRIGLSATLGDMNLAKMALRPDDPDQVLSLESAAAEAELRLQIRGYETPRDKRAEDDEEAAEPSSVIHAISAHLHKTLRGSSHLAFAGSRQKVELYADRLRQMSEDQGVPNEFFPHHGSLARELRHEVEARLKKGDWPTTAVCTTTLELGIDIGDVESVAQIGAPRSIAALRQRLGRSGRRPGKPSILRIYTIERPLDAKSSLLDRLRLETVLSVAAVRLLLSRWCEPPLDEAMHLSTLLHQILSSIASQGAAHASGLYGLLCEKGPFRQVSRSVFADLLRRMGDRETGLLEQAPDGTLLLGAEGEKLVEHYSFYAVFETPEEFRIEANGKSLGTIPVDFPLHIGALIVFAGRRWEVVDVHDLQKVIQVKPAAGGLPPRFGGEGSPLHERIVSEIRVVFEGSDVPPYLDRLAAQHLEEARAAYHAAGLSDLRCVEDGENTLLFPWVGGKDLSTLVLALNGHGLQAAAEDIAVFVRAPAGEVGEALRSLARNPPPPALELARGIENKRRHKFDRFLDEELLARDLVSEGIQTGGLPKIAVQLLHGHGRHLEAPEDSDRNRTDELN